jgi:hypothetical protein
MHKDGVHHRWLVHRLVAQYFVPNPNQYPVVNHIDGNRLNNDYKNLEYTTQRMNLYAAQLQGKMPGRIEYPYVFTNLETGERFVVRTLKEGFLRIGEITAYCYHSQKYKQHRAVTSNPYVFKQWSIDILTSMPLWELDINEKQC